MQELFLFLIFMLLLIIIFGLVSMLHTKSQECEAWRELAEQQFKHPDRLDVIGYKPEERGRK